ncbi:MAG: hypothetical protein SFY81_11125 [Verrucomicrobiota bacterium]|nr:hypothetical protein [Verrucomicrobiota bacterium]
MGLSRVYVHGSGAVSPGGWGAAALYETIEKGIPLRSSELQVPGRIRPLSILPVPPPVNRPSYLNHARLRRSSALSQHSVAAGREALGNLTPRVENGALRLGVIFCVMSGCVAYSRRFYDETLKDPQTASPLVFPETVFNAPASHISALLNLSSINYTLVGDPGVFFQGLALAAQWLASDHAQAVLVVGAEELDWITAEALGYFVRGIPLSAGAGALCLTREPSDVELGMVTDPLLIRHKKELAQFVPLIPTSFPPSQPHCLVENRPPSKQMERLFDAWTGDRVNTKTIIGEGLMAGSAWQSIYAVQRLIHKNEQRISVVTVGPNQLAIGAQFLGIK